MKTSVKDMFDDLSAGGNDDYLELWIPIDWVADSLGLDRNHLTLDEAGKFWTTLTSLINHMLTNGFEAVNLKKDGGCTPWPEQDPKQVMARIRSEWVALKGKFPDVGFIVWFNKIHKTPKKK